MEFNRILNLFTISTIVIMLICTVTCACFIITSRGNSNLGVGFVTENEKNNQLTAIRF